MAAPEMYPVVVPDGRVQVGMRAPDLNYLRELAAYWQDRYDWRQHETALNHFTHFKSEVDGGGIHFIHERGKGPKPFPLILRMAIRTRFTVSRK